ETDFQLGLDCWIVLKLTGDFPREHETPWRIPDSHTTPIAFTSVDAALEPATADERLDRDALRVDLPDLVGGKRPPRAHPFGEHLECALDRCRNQCRLLDRNFGVRTSFRLNGSHDLFVSLRLCCSCLVVFSAAALTAASA